MKGQIFILRLGLVLHCFVIPSAILLFSVKKWGMEKVTLLGLLIAIGWSYFWGKKLNKRLFDLPDDNDM